MSLIKVTSEELHNLSSQVNSGASSIQDQLSTLQNQVTSVVGGEWQGAASSQFNALYEEWQRSAQALHESLTGIGQLLGNAATQYQATEDSVKSSF